MKAVFIDDELGAVSFLRQWLREQFKEYKEFYAAHDESWRSIAAECTNADLILVDLSIPRSIFRDHDEHEDREAEGLFLSNKSKPEDYQGIELISRLRSRSIEASIIVVTRHRISEEVHSKLKKRYGVIEVHDKTSDYTPLLRDIKNILATRPREQQKK